MIPKKNKGFHLTFNKKLRKILKHSEKYPGKLRKGIMRLQKNKIKKVLTSFWLKNTLGKSRRKKTRKNTPKKTDSGGKITFLTIVG